MNHTGSSNGRRDVGNVKPKEGRRKKLLLGSGGNICRCKGWPSDINCGYKYRKIVVAHLRHSREGASNYK